MYLVMTLNRKQRARVANSDIEADISISWAHGMVGAIPVFETREDAEKYANGANIIEIGADEK